GGFELVFGKPRAGGAERKPADIEDVEGDDMSAADFVQQVFAGHLAILEEDRDARTAAQAHFLFLGPDRKSRKAALDDKGGKFFAVHFREDREYSRESAVGDPHVLAVQDAMAAVRRQSGPGAGIQRDGT